MSEFILKKAYENHFGLDLKSNDLTRQIQFASDMMNAQYRKDGAIEKRKGYQPYSADAGGYGLHLYARTNPTTGANEPEVLSVSSGLHKLNLTTLTVSYGGANPSVMISLFFDPADSQYHCQITEGTTLVVDQDLGTGFDEVSPVTITALAAVINAATGFTAVVAGVGTVSAALLKIVRDYDLSSATGSDLELTAGYWTTVANSGSAPFAGSLTNESDEDFENVTAAQIQNVLYLSNGYDYPKKYDGQRVYRSGLPTPATLTAATGAGGSITGTNYLYRQSFVQIDAVGNVIEGNTLLQTSSAVNPVAQSINVVLDDIQAGDGFNTAGAIVAGAQATTNTITVDDGSGGSHTLVAGDKAYFYDAVTVGYVTRNITAIAATTITVDGAPVTVADNAVISNDLRIAIYRSKSSGSTPTAWYLVEEIPNNSFAATQTYLDDKVDASLGAQWIEPVTDRSPPPKGRYVSVFRNQMIVSGNIERPNAVFYSDVDGPEYHPSEVNEFDVETIAGDRVTGIAANNELFSVFKGKSIHIVSGNIADGTIRVDQLTYDLGCVAHATIQEIRGSLAFLSDRGPYVMTGGQIPQPLGEGRIEPFFDTRGLLMTQVPRFKRAIGLNRRQDEQYWIFIPTETVSLSGSYANDNSVLFVFDYYRGAWLRWDSINAAGGAVVLYDELFFSERRYSSFTGQVDSILYRQHSLKDAWDYQDHLSPIEFEYKTQWDALGEPSVPKRFLRLKVFGAQDTPNGQSMIGVQSETDYIADRVFADYPIDFSGNGYGLDSYGDAPYGGISDYTDTHRLNTGRVKSLRLIFSNSEDQQNCEIRGWETEVAAPYRKALKP